MTPNTYKDHRPILLAVAACAVALLVMLAGNVDILWWQRAAWTLPLALVALGVGGVIGWYERQLRQPAHQLLSSAGDVLSSITEIQGRLTHAQVVMEQLLDATWIAHLELTDAIVFEAEQRHRQDGGRPNGATS
jgi:hypothetical protein